MGQSTVTKPAGTQHPTGGITEPLVKVNLQLLLSHIEMNSQYIQQFVTNNGATLTYDNNAEKDYLESVAVPLLRELRHGLQSNLNRLTSFADATAVDSERYNHVIAEASYALATASLFLEPINFDTVTLLQSHPVPEPTGNPMLFGVGEHITLETATDNHPVEMMADEHILEIEVQKEERDSFFADSSELSTTNVPRSKTTSSHQTPATTEPADEDIAMPKQPQEEPKPVEKVRWRFKSKTGQRPTNPCRRNQSQPPRN